MQHFSEKKWIHTPVGLSQVIELLNISREGVYVDGTFGEGGHSKEILKKEVSQLIAIDKDKEALERYQKHHPSDPRLSFRHTSFSSPGSLPVLDGVLLDLGPSTRQLLEPLRGFSFSSSAPLDMRMDPSRGAPLSQKLSEIESSEVRQKLIPFMGIGNYERLKSDVMAKKINTTLDLARVAGMRKGPTHPATRLFMALRIWINEEMEEIQKAIPLYLSCLRSGGRLVVITFHSEEDRLVKRLFEKFCGKCRCPLQPCDCSKPAVARAITKKALIVSDAERDSNPRARSAKIRCVEKL